jgi:hypothetical protein
MLPIHGVDAAQHFARSNGLSGFCQAVRPDLVLDHRFRGMPAADRA